MRAVFLDRDGVIIENRADYVKSWREVSFVPGSIEAIARLAGWTCQSSSSPISHASEEASSRRDR